MKYYTHGQWMDGDELLAFIFKDEDGQIYFEDTPHSRARKLNILPEGAEVVSPRVQDSVVRAEVVHNPDVKNPERGGS